jgi:hypothetical protein
MRVWLRLRKAVPPPQRRREIGLPPFGMPGRLLESRTTSGSRTKKGVDEPCDATIPVGVTRPVINCEHGADSHRLDRAALGDQTRIVVARQLGREIVLLQRLRIAYRQELPHSGETSPTPHYFERASPPRRGSSFSDTVVLTPPSPPTTSTEKPNASQSA